MKDFLKRISTGDKVALEIGQPTYEIGVVMGFQIVAGHWTVTLKDERGATWKRPAAQIHHKMIG